MTRTNARNTVTDTRQSALEGGAMQHYRNLPIPDTLADICDPDRMALVVYDMQVGVVSQLADGPQVIDRVSRVLGAARQAGVRVFFMRYMTLPTELIGTFQLRMAMAWRRKDRVEDVVSPFLRDSPGFEIVPELAPIASEAVLTGFRCRPSRARLSSSRCATHMSPPLRSSASRPRSGSSPPFGTAPIAASSRSWLLMPVGPGTMLRPSARSTPLPPRATLS
jgi:Isochorismatase family